MATRAPWKKALLVGINNFRNVNGLQGCVNDSLNMKSLLMTLFGFNSTDIHQLANIQATKASILKEIQWLVRDALRGDSLVFHYSSHGSQIPDTSGDETDGMDEILCCYDMDWSGHGYITDDDLARLAQQVPAGVFVEGFFDTCFSGTGHSVVSRSGVINPVGIERTILVEKRRIIRVPVRPRVHRFLQPPDHLVAVMEGRTRINRVLSPLLERGVAPKGIGVFQALWSGCGEQQTSADAFIGGKYNGAFTYYWCEAVKRLHGKISRNDILKRIREKLVTDGYDQIPELTCSDSYASKFLFS